MKSESTPTEEFESYYGVKILKKRENRTTAEDVIINSLYWLIGRTLSTSIVRHASVIEGCLTIEGKLDLYKPLEPMVIEEKFLWFTVKGIEPYDKMMRRMGLLYLKEKGVVK